MKLSMASRGVLSDPSSHPSLAHPANAAAARTLLQRPTDFYAGEGGSLGNTGLSCYRYRIRKVGRLTSTSLRTLVR